MTVVDFDKIATSGKFMRRHVLTGAMAICGNEDVPAVYEKRHSSVVCLRCNTELPNSFVMGNPNYECVVEDVK